MGITHAKVSLIPTNSSNSLVQPTDWNANHVITSPLDLTGITVIGLTLGSLATAIANPVATGSAITQTTLYTPTVSGIYLVFIDTLVTQAGSAGQVSTTIGWNNGVTSASINTTPFSLATTGEQAAESGNFYCLAGQAITYSTTVTGATGSPLYQLRLRLLALG